MSTKYTKYKLCAKEYTIAFYTSLESKEITKSIFAVQIKARKNLPITKAQRVKHEYTPSSTQYWTDIGLTAYHSGDSHKGNYTFLANSPVKTDQSELGEELVLNCASSKPPGITKKIGFRVCFLGIKYEQDVVFEFRLTGKQIDNWNDVVIEFFDRFRKETT